MLFSILIAKVYRAHWTVESECEIHYNLCVAYMKLHLYEKAVIEGCKFKNLLKVLTDIRLVKPRLKNHPAVTHTMQVCSEIEFFLNF